jgi:CysZ protein
MSQLFSNVVESIKMMKKDKVNILLCLAPIIIGIIIYFTLGKFFYSDLKDWIHALVTSKITSDTWGAVLYYIFMAILWILIFFIVNWTFVLLVSLVASPFNDLLSERCEKMIQGEIPGSAINSLKQRFGIILKIIFNEVKKLSFIISLSLIAFVLNFFPLFTPLTLVLTSILMAINFLDYSWSRHHLTLSECLSEIKKNFWIYTLSGFAFMFLMTIPVANLIALPFGVVFFTLARIKRN